MSQKGNYGWAKKALVLAKAEPSYADAPGPQSMVIEMLAQQAGKDIEHLMIDGEEYVLLDNASIPELLAELSSRGVGFKSITTHGDGKSIPHATLELEFYPHKQNTDFSKKPADDEYKSWKMEAGVVMSQFIEGVYTQKPIKPKPSQELVPNWDAVLKD